MKQYASKHHHAPLFPEEGELHDVVWREKLVEVERIDIDCIDFQREALRLVACGIDHHLHWRQVIERAVPRRNGVGLADRHAFAIVEKSSIEFANLHDFDVGYQFLSLLDIRHLEFLLCVKRDRKREACLLTDKELKRI